MPSATAPDQILSLVSTRSAAAILGCHPRTVRRLKDAGRARVAIESGKPMKWLSEHLGHSSMVVTATIYAHVSVERQRALVDDG